MAEGTLLIRADANVVMGTGHVMRCLALAQAWQDDGGRVVFAMAPPASSVRQRLLNESVKILEMAQPAGTREDAARTAALAREHEAAWVVVDGYQFGADYQQALKSANLKILFLDDYGHADHYFADVVMNQNVSAEDCPYENRETYTRLLLGPKYCLLRREFNQWREWRREILPAGHRVLVTMGGSDPQNFTARAIDALNLIADDNLEAAVIVGGSNDHFESLETRAAKAGKKISVCRDVSNMAERMAWADVAVSAAGTTCWEMCLLGLPAILVDLAENQIPVAKALDQRGCAIYLGGPGEVSSQRLASQMESLMGSRADRQALSVRCRELVDGRGAQRVVAALRGGKLRLRPAQENDAQLLWKWANESSVRAAAFSSAPIPWEQHEAWFTRKMKDPDCRILIAEDGQGRAVGQFRIQWRTSQDADIDISVPVEFRGSGYGRWLIDLGVSQVLAERQIARIHAFVKPENVASCRSVEFAGFKKLGEENVDGHTAIHYILTGKSDKE